MKYPRTYHFEFSPGATSDDRINGRWWENLELLKEIVITEKLDGENRCLSKEGVFARSHSSPTVSPWSKHILPKWESIKNDLGELKLYGEDLYAVHSIEYKSLPSYFFMFGVLDGKKWLSWDEVKWIAEFFDFPVVPEIEFNPLVLDNKEEFVTLIEETCTGESRFGSMDAETKTICPMEGIVVKSKNAFDNCDFSKNVFKWVRKNHVKTDAHWTTNWKRAKLYYEKPI